MAKTKTIKAFKGFEHDMTCKGFQYEVGKIYTQKGTIEPFKNGFHACPTPLDIFGYYAPIDDKGNLRRYAEVEQSGTIKTDTNKIASSKIEIKAELSIAELVKCHVDFIKENTISMKDNTGDRSAATNTGNWSAATNTGDRSAATNTGDRSAATNTGNGSAATNTGDWSAATNTGDRSAASVEQENSAAFAFGYQSRAKAKKGWIIIVDWRDDEDGGQFIQNIFTSKVGGKILNTVIQPDTWYWFEDGILKKEKV